ncbi:hypothetical protein J2Z35_002789 [Acetoanaerobium pronyense]|uniref:Transcriptional regulator, AbiEi antitoxin, Type IV TA system n=1 Tax=Acetoanaerobium pronyense TaxID=1482736 RepID=A0ABS4KPA2_9FIRM|nr:DUF6088 family protein [Acetoanaerobium pronyense]MBP2028951.1 hypothetical protein [Acetoanaerobium pronyense]
MSYSSRIIESINEYPELTIIDTQKLYKEKFNDVSEQAFYKTISRMSKNEDIERISKGIYCKPRRGRFGTTISSEKNILEHYLGINKNRGIVIGYQMYNNKGLTTQLSKTIELYSNITFQEKKQIKNVIIYKANIRFDISTIKMIELLEVLQNYRNIEDLNIIRFKKIIEDSIKYYDEKTIQKLIKAIGYKKHTIASLKNILDFFNIENKVDHYLHGTSRYNALRMEELYGVTS